jgi:hypothetical protein
MLTISIPRRMQSRDCPPAMVDNDTISIRLFSASVYFLKTGSLLVSENFSWCSVRGNDVEDRLFFFSFSLGAVGDYSINRNKRQ